MKKHRHLLLVAAALVIGAALRTWNLSGIPSGLYQDETAIGYNAYSILETGKDEHGAAYPVYFRSFGDYKLPVYIYMTALSVRSFGLNAIAVRAPSVAWGIASILIIYALVYALSGNKMLGALSSLLLALNPWHIHYSRAAFEVSPGLAFFMLGTLFLHLSFARPKKGMLYLGTLFFILSLYTYNLTRLLSPLLYAGTLFVYRRFRHRPSKTEYILTAVSSIILLFPFAGTFFSPGGVSSSYGTLITSSAAVQSGILEFKSYLTAFPRLVSGTVFNTRVLTLYQFMKNAAGYLSVPFFFIEGPRHGNHGIGTMGLLYLFDLLLIPVGFLSLKKSRPPLLSLLLLWVFSTVLSASLTREAPHATRSFFLLFPLMVFSSGGLLSLLRYAGRAKAAVFAPVVYCTAFSVFVFSFLFFAASYFVRFPVYYAPMWKQQDPYVVSYIRDREREFDKIVIDDRSGFVYTSLLFYLPFSPDAFHNSRIVSRPDSEGFLHPVSFGKFEFRNPDWVLDRSPKTLIITKEEYVPEGMPVDMVFSYPVRPVVIAQKQDIYQFPAQDTAYVAVVPESQNQ